MERKPSGISGESMASEYSYILTDIAEADINRIISCPANTLHNPSAASSLADGIEEELLLICSSPYIGTPVINHYVKRSDVRKAFVMNYVLYYFPDTDKNVIVVLRIGHTFQNQDQLLKKPVM